VGKTRHIQARMAQRAISQKLVHLTLEFGVERPDGKVVLNRQGLSHLLEKISSLKKVAQKAYDKGGLVVVSDGDTLITTYRLASYNPALGRGDAERRAG
jgi:hypothetical protein